MIVLTKRWTAIVKGEVMIVVRVFGWPDDINIPADIFCERPSDDILARLAGAFIAAERRKPRLDWTMIPPGRHEARNFQSVNVR
jgi:hypothetical protein